MRRLAAFRFGVACIVPALMVPAMMIAAVEPGLAAEADVTAVEVSRSAAGKWLFDVTVRHGDTGWEHYANRWEVVAPDGTVLGTRVLAHPHVDEQPFTRSGEIDISDSVSEVTVRAHDLVHGLGGAEVKVALPR